MINKDVVSKLNPCKDRFDNYLKFYSEKSHSKRQFMGLKNITHEDKLWVAFRLMSKDNIRLALADIAESVLHIYEEKYPNDKIPRIAIEATRANKVTKEIIDNAAYASDAAYFNAAHAAYAAHTAHTAHTAHAAAASAAHAASLSAHAATAAYSSTYASDAASIATQATNDKLKQEKLIRTIILKYWKDV